MRDDVNLVEDEVVRVQLTNLEDPTSNGHLLVDMRRGLWIEYARPSSTLRLVHFDDELPEVPFDRV